MMNDEDGQDDEVQDGRDDKEKEREEQEPS